MKDLERNAGSSFTRLDYIQSSNSKKLSTTQGGIYSTSVLPDFLDPNSGELQDAQAPASVPQNQPSSTSTSSGTSGGKQSPGPRAQTPASGGTQGQSTTTTVNQSPGSKDRRQSPGTGSQSQPGSGTTQSPTQQNQTSVSIPDPMVPHPSPATQPSPAPMTPGTPSPTGRFPGSLKPPSPRQISATSYPMTAMASLALLQLFVSKHASSVAGYSDKYTDASASAMEIYLHRNSTKLVDCVAA